jgi:lauroyl/myristoyl acyltransferase
LRRYWHVSGDPLPDAQQYPAVLFVTFHYGQGFWALRYFQQHGLQMAALYRPPPKPARGEHFNYWFFWVRLRSIFRLTKTEPIRVGDEQSELSALVRRLVRHQQPVGVMPDIPTNPAHAVEVSLLGKRAYFASALLRLVVKKKIPVVLYTSVLDLNTAARNVNIQVLYEQDSVDELAQSLACCLESAILRDATAWHLWPWAHEIITE